MNKILIFLKELFTKFFGIVEKVANVFLVKETIIFITLCILGYVVLNMTAEETKMLGGELIIYFQYIIIVLISAFISLFYNLSNKK